MLLDLNLEALQGWDSACDETDIGGDDSGASATASSSAAAAAAGDDESNCSSHTLTPDAACDAICTLNFSILKGNQAIGVEEESNAGDLVVMKNWLNLSAGGGAEVEIRKPPQIPPVKKSRRGPRSRSSQYRGVTFYRRTGRWESHIWDCGKQIYLGGFDTDHFAARAYDRAALKFRGVDADINFHTSDYDEDMKQMKNMTKEEVVQILRRHSTGFSKGSSRYRGLTLHKGGQWEVAQTGQFQVKKANDKAAIKCNGRGALTDFEASAYGEMETQPVDAGVGNGLDLNLWISPPLDTKKLEFNFGTCKMPVLTTVGSSPATPHSPAMASKYSIWTGMHSGLIIPNTQEQLVGMRAETLSTSAISNWQWKMQNQGVVTSVPLYSSAASSGFYSTTTHRKTII